VNSKFWKQYKRIETKKNDEKATDRIAWLPERDKDYTARCLITDDAFTPTEKRPLKLCLRNDSISRNSYDRLTSMEYITGIK
jgi:hypothetical protein